MTASKAQRGHTSTMVDPGSTPTDPAVPEPGKSLDSIIRDELRTGLAPVFEQLRMIKALATDASLPDQERGQQFREHYRDVRGLIR